MRSFIITGILISAFIIPSAAQEPTQVDLTQLLRFDPDTRYGRLTNGLTYYIKNTKEKDQKVFLEVVVKAGRVHEEMGQLGAAHLLEHLGFRSLKHFPNGMKTYLREVGIKDGSEVNASTGWNCTKYYLTVPNNEEILDSSMYILRDWTDGFSLLPHEIASERGIVIAEIRGSLETNRHLKTEDSKLLQNPKYRADEIDRLLNHYRNFKNDDLVEFYRKWYRPDRQAVIIVGNVDVEKIELRIKRLFSTLQTPRTSLSDRQLISQWAVKRPKSTVITEERPKSKSADIRLFNILPFNIAERDCSTVDQCRQAIVDHLFNQMLGFRMQAMRPLPPPLLYSASISRNAIDPSAQVDLFSFTFQSPTTDSLEFRFKRAFAELNLIKTYGFDNTEFDKAKSEMQNILKRSSNTSLEELAAKYTNHFINRAAVPSPSDLLKLKLLLLKDITLVDLNAASTTWIDGLNDGIAIVRGPTEIFTNLNKNTVFKWIADSKHNIPERTSHDVLKSLPRPPDSLMVPIDVNEATTDLQRNVGVSQFNLKSATVIMKPIQSTAQPKIRMHCFRPGGARLYTGGARYNALNAAQIIARSGIAGLSEIDLQRVLWGKDVRVDPYIIENEEGITASCQPADLELMLQLVYFYFTQPNYSQVTFNSWIKERRTGAAGAVTSNYTPLIPKTSDDTNDEVQSEFLNLDSAYSIFKQRFSSLKGFTFVFTGNLDESANRLILKYIHALPNSFIPIMLSQERNCPDISGSSTIVSMTESSRVTIRYTGHFNYNESSNLTLRTLSEYLKIRLFDRIRQQEGATYSLATDLTTDKAGEYSLNIAYEVSPTFDKRSIQIIKEEIADLKQRGPASETFKQAIAQVLAANKTDLNQSRFWVNYLVDRYRFNEPVDVVLKRDELIRSLSISDLQHAANQYLINDN